MGFLLHHPGSVSEAVAAARRLGEGARFIAGGTDLIIQINRKRQAPEHLIDLTRLGELSGIAEEADAYRLGALTTHKEIERHHAFRSVMAALPEAARVVGGHQVRNIATIGGNIANASPAADVVVALLALDAELELIGPDGGRTSALDAFLLGPGRTSRAGDELIRSIRVPKPPMPAASAFLKAGRRKAMEISVVCVAARLTVNDDGTCREARISLGAVGPRAARAKEAEAALSGRAPEASAFREAGRIAAANCTPIDDVRASAAYRRLLVEALVPRALAACAARIAEARQ